MTHLGHGLFEIFRIAFPFKLIYDVFHLNAVIYSLRCQIWS
jgi:hypothetical protein